MARLTFLGADLLTPLGIAQGSLHIDGTVVCDEAGRGADLSGYLIAPGIVDLHGDGFERHLAPRRGAVTNYAAGLRALEAELGASGITTAWLAQFWSWEGGMRAPGFARQMARALEDFDAAADLRIQLRFETHLTHQVGEVIDFIRAASIDYVAFNDNLPHKALEAGRTPPRLTGSALRSGRSPETHLAIMQAAHDRGAEVEPALARLVSALPHVRFASHDDNSAATRQRFAALGANIAEFPLTDEAASGQVVMGAPNVVRGRSQHGNLSAHVLIAADRCAALASDYHYPSMVEAVRTLVRDGCDLAEVWDLVSGRPARIMGLSDRGTLKVGSRADLVILDSKTLQVEGTMAAGRWTWLRDPLATRLMG